MEVITPFKRLNGLIQLERKATILLLSFALFNGVINLSLPLGIQAIINLIQGGEISSSWWVLILFVIAGIGFAGVIQIFMLSITENIQQRIFTRSSLEFAFRLPKISMKALYGHYPPELMNRFFDTLTVQKGLAKILVDFSVSSLQVVFALILLGLYHPFFVVLCFFALLILFILYRFTVPKGLATSLQESKYKYSVASWLEEVARAITTFKMAGTSTLHLDKTNDQVEGYLDSRQNHFGVLKFQYQLMVVFKMVVTGAFLVVGGILVLNQQMNIGQFVAAEIVILLISASVEKMVLSLETIYDVLTALEKMGQVVDLELEKNTGRKLLLEDNCKGLSVSLNNVVLKYPNNEKPALNDINLSIKAGEKVAIVGYNGSGKSSLLYTIAALFEPDNGVVTFNDIPTANLDIPSLRDNMGDYLSSQALFEGSLIENINNRKHNVSTEDVVSMLRKMNLYDFIIKQPGGLEMRIHPIGSRLSRSIQRRIMLARAIIHKPKLLLLEHALDAVEPEIKQTLISMMVDENAPWTMVTVTNDPLFVKMCDRIIVLNEGKIIADGTFKELSSKDWFKELIVC